MKLTKKLFSIILAVVMLAIMAIPTFAADEQSGSIVINNAVKGQTYTAYRILELESYSDSDPDDEQDGLYAYKVTSEWKSFVESNAIKNVYLDVNEYGGVTWHENADAASFAALAIAHAKANPSTITGASVTATSENVTISNLYLGYYLVDTSLGSLCSLGTTDVRAEIEEKNEAPTIKKELGETPATTDSEKETENTVEVGTVVNYVITVHAKKDATNYVVHDKMSAGLTFNNDIAIDNVEAEYYTVETKDLEDECTFHIVFKEEYLKTITSNTDIVIKYTATVNKNAVTNAGVNNAKLDYGNVSDNEWTGGTTTTTTYSFDIVKTDKSKVLLNGATFRLYRSLNGTDEVKLVKDGNIYRVATAEEIEDNKTVSVIELTGGKATVAGLAGNTTYYLEEVSAPEGYNKLSARKEVALGTADLDANITDDTYVDGGVQVVNQSGTELPSTGGIGTTLFYIAGGAMFIGALVILVTKKRMKD